MRIVLSRKGFDATAGGGASPILPDGRMVSLPIRERLKDRISHPRYDELRLDGFTYLDLIQFLGHRGFEPDAVAHLDPDLVPQLRRRNPLWRGLFGQVNVAARHLRKQGIGPGDLFLFWGRFCRTRPAESGDGLSREAPKAKDFHAIYGYLEVETVVDAQDPNERSRLAWASDFPHFATPDRGEPNFVYVAREWLSHDPSRPGWGVFRWHSELRLTRSGRDMTCWELPGCLHPSVTQVSYLRRETRWGPYGERTTVTVPGRGQEFVAVANPDVTTWATSLVSRCEIWAPE